MLFFPTLSQTHKPSKPNKGICFVMIEKEKENIGARYGQCDMVKRNVQKPITRSVVKYIFNIASKKTNNQQIEQNEQRGKKTKRKST